jgi:predicted ribonuclease YlaK
MTRKRGSSSIHDNQDSSFNIREKSKSKFTISEKNLLPIKPLTKNQEKLFDSYDSGKNLLVHGSAGTGKSFCLIYKALQEVLDERTVYDRLYIVRSLVPTREIGFLPGSHEDKADIYQIPYKNMVKYMFQMPNQAQFEMLYGNLKSEEIIKFWSTSFLRGTTLENSIIIVDEMSNLSFHELDSIITRVGKIVKLCSVEIQNRVICLRNMSVMDQWNL